jgi:hypothetical protein
LTVLIVASITLVVNTETLLLEGSITRALRQLRKVSSLSVEKYSWRRRNEYKLNEGRFFA